MKTVLIILGVLVFCALVTVLGAILAGGNGRDDENSEF